MNQGAIFRESEGDAWFTRNQVYLKTASSHDMVLRLLGLGIPPLNKDSYVLEIGCSNGWRIAALQEHYGIHGYGIDVSEAAIRDGQRQWPGLNLSVGSAKDVGEWLPISLDLVIINFVLHWVHRPDVLPTVAAIDSIIGNRNFLIVGDFLPDSPEEVPYHHKEGLWTYKHDYTSLFLPAGFRIRKEIIYDHDSGQIGNSDIPSSRRAHATLLQKVYQWET